MGEAVLGHIVRRLLVLVILSAAIVALVRLLRVGNPDAGADRPEGSDEPPADGHSDDRDLTLVRGIGPVYRERLAGAGIVGPAELSRADPVQVAAAAEVTESRASQWIARAAALDRR